ncbi:sulfotransferase family protein [Metapseudomonas resinovorans]|uniref:sulfotransferase family protein n=1 Tax=Metapseudomonas resinovorans TaxID=53412 RepID=UPI00042096DB|nr:sulfotransferase [Pseudomonas resinovorans]
MISEPLSFNVATIELLSLPEEVEGFSLDAPTANAQYNGHSLPIAGWASGRSPYVVPSIEIMNGETLLKRVPIQVPRPDVADYLKKAPGAGNKFGFHGFIGTLGLHNSTRLDIVLNIYDPRDQSRVKKNVATIRGKKNNSLLTESKYQPLMLTAIGRSGTTLVMQILGEHNKILTSNFYPYEVKQSAYWMHLLKVLNDPADFDNSSHPDKFESNLGLIGHNPYTHQESMRQFKEPDRFYDYYNKKLPRELVKFSVSRIEEFYDLIAASEKRPDAVYFAEKFLPTHLQPMFNDVFTKPKEIILTRDFRDMICSAQSFNEKRNSQAFGRERASDEFDWVHRIFSTGARRVVEAWEDRKYSAIHVRYEDLILEPEAQMKRIFEYLEIDSSTSLIHKIKEKIFNSSGSTHHKTSENPEKSIARWKNEMPKELLEYCNEKLSKELKTFGYE